MRLLLLAGVALLVVANATVKTGDIAIADAPNVASLGRVSQTPNLHGKYVITTDTASRLRLRVSYDDT